MAKYEAEQAKELVSELRVLLRVWWINRDSDSVRIQQVRAGELATGERLFADLLYGVKPENKLQIAVGTTALRASSFDKGAYDFYTERRVMLEPGSTLDLVRADYWTRHLRDGLGNTRGRRTLFVGSFSRLVSIDRIAESLADNGGEITLVEGEQPNLIAAANEISQPESSS